MTALANLFKSTPQAQAAQTGIGWGNGLDQSNYSDTIDQAQQLALQQAQAQAAGTTGAQQQQNSLMAQLASQAKGGGPNLANQQLQQATQQNTAQQAGAIASQKGINPAQAARQINVGTAAADQGAARQASINRMQQQLAAQQGLGALSGQVRGQDLASQQAAQGLYGTSGQLQQGQNQLGLQNAGLNAQLQNQVNIANLGANSAAQQQGTQLLGGLLGAGASGAASLIPGKGTTPTGAGNDNPGVAAWTGGEIQRLGSGGIVWNDPRFAPTPDPTSDQTPPSKPSGIAAMVGNAGRALTQGTSPDVMQFYHPLAHGGQVPVVLSPGEKVLSPEQARSPRAPMIAAKVAADKHDREPLQHGGRVPGKAAMPGDNPKNDTYRTSLRKGSMVLPRTVADDPSRAVSFMEAQALKRHAKRGGAVGHVLAAGSDNERREQIMEALTKTPRKR